MVDTINNGFFFVIDIIIGLQGYFTSIAWGIARTALLIAVLTMGLNYALTGSNIKENIIKLIKATVFCLIILQFYPKIVNWITSQSYAWAAGGVYADLKPLMEKAKEEMAEQTLDTAAANTGPGTFGNQAMMSPKSSEEKNPAAFFGSFVKTRSMTKDGVNIKYTTVAPAAVLQAILLVSGECLQYAFKKEDGFMKFPDFGAILIGVFCAFLVIFVGVFGVLEYLVAFIEFALVSSVGIILFPLSIWEGSRFMSESFVKVLIGFFIKLLICTLCIFIMLYGFLKMAALYASSAFTGTPDEIISVIFSSLLFFFICKSAPAVAQSLMTGSPSLTGQAAIAAAAGAVAAAATGGAIAKGVAGAGAKTAFNAGGAAQKMIGAAQGAKAAGGGVRDMMGAAAGALGGSAKEGIKAIGHDLSRSLLGGKSGGAGGSGDSGNTHSNRQQFLAGEKGETLKEHTAARKAEGQDAGKKYMEAKKENAGTA